MTRSLPCAIVVFLCGGVAWAHHSIAGMYDQGRRVNLDGVVAQFHYVNPHPYVVLEVAGSNGRTEQWRLELDNRRELVEVGVADDTLKYGDRLVVSGSPGRTDPRTMYVWKLERPADGFLYEQIGTSPRVRGLRR